MYQTASRPRADAYRRIGVETSMHTIDQHQIIVLLYEGLLQEIARARGALARQDVPAKCDAITRALRILQEGLVTGLDLVEGGEIAQNLNALYEYCAHQLVMANARNDDARLQEVYALIEPVAQGWKAIKQPGQGTGA
ncbi:MAG: flagellar export chaperone FliS [Hylemonella sp.]|uniref:flagellar export chaperone FliS n=1 Tax=Hylemonella sp. TaxID=2066020 RepID=UPI00391A1875